MSGGQRAVRQLEKKGPVNSIDGCAGVVINGVGRQGGGGVVVDGDSIIMVVHVVIL